MFSFGVFFAVVALMSLWLAVHPFTTYPFSLWLVRLIGGKVPLQPREESRPKTFSIVFCAYNEERVVSAKLDNMKQIQDLYGSDSVAVLAYNDCSADRTLEILNNHPAVVEVINGQTRGGKSVGMNQIIERAKSEIVIFTDANVILSPEIIPEFAAVFADPHVGLACGHLVYVNKNTPTATVGTSYWQLEESMKQLESDTGSVIGADGSLFAARRSLLGPIPADIIDDFFTSVSVLCNGARVVRCGKALAFETSAESSVDEYRRKVRIACRVFNCHRLLWNRLRKVSIWNQYKYFSRKLIRWFVAIWLIIAAISTCAAIGLLFHWQYGATAAAVCVVGFLAIQGASRAHLPVATEMWEVWLAFWGTFHGVYRSLRGERMQTWNPVASSRKVVDNSVVR